MEKSTTIAVDLAKDVFEVAVADARGRILERKRLARSHFVGFFENRVPCAVILEACGTAHHWARMIRGFGHTVRLLPVQYVVAYRRRNKTDRADCEALLQAARNPEIHAVAVKTIEQQTIQQLHRVRTQWMRTRTNRINLVRGVLRELGLAMPVGAATAKQRAAELAEALPERPRLLVTALLAEIHALERRAGQTDGQGWQTLEPPAALGRSPGEPKGPQQGDLRAREQTRANRLGDVAARARVRRELHCHRGGGRLRRRHPTFRLL